MMTEIISEFVKYAFEVDVDCDMNLDEMITAAGYSDFEPEITDEHFPIAETGKKVVKIDLLGFNRGFNVGYEAITAIEAVNVWLAQQGADYRYRSARIEEALAVRPEIQGWFAIVVLGSVWLRHGLGDTVVVRGNGELFFNLLGSSYGGRELFAVVREPL